MKHVSVDLRIHVLFCLAINMHFLFLENKNTSSDFQFEKTEDLCFHILHGFILHIFDLILHLCVLFSIQTSVLKSTAFVNFSFKRRKMLISVQICKATDVTPWLLLVREEAW